ncbi:MAG: DUF6899 family protein [Candidatus Thorarchaeota archaeon]
MPYITKEDRRELHRVVGGDLDNVVHAMETSQDLAQVIFHLMWMYLCRVVTNHKSLIRRVQSLKSIFRRCAQVQTLERWCTAIGMEAKIHPGHYNYIISFIIHQWLGRHGLSYTHINRVIGILDDIKFHFQKELSCFQSCSREMDVIDDVRGVLTCVQLELYRVIAAPYEDGKAKENGPVSALDEPFFSCQKETFDNRS